MQEFQYKIQGLKTWKIQVSKSAIAYEKNNQMQTIPRSSITGIGLGLVKIPGGILYRGLIRMAIRFIISRKQIQNKHEMEPSQVKSENDLSKTTIIAAQLIVAYKGVESPKTKVKRISVDIYNPTCIKMIKTTKESMPDLYLGIDESVKMEKKLKIPQTRVIIITIVVIALCLLFAYFKTFHFTS